MSTHALDVKRYKNRLQHELGRGASVRVPVENGVVLEARVQRSDVLAYLTRRDEEEVILDAVLP